MVRDSEPNSLGLEILLMSDRPKENSFKVHVSRVHQKVAEISPCNLCGKLLSGKHLESHIETVHGVKKFKCNICDDEFREESILQKHKEKYHEKFSCSICTKVYVGTYLANHLKFHAELNSSISIISS